MSKTEVINLQKALRETIAPELSVDGVWGSQSIKALNNFSSAHNVNVADGETMLHEYIDMRFANDESFKQAAALLGVPESYVRAVAEVETNGESFLPDGRVKILFERHWFYKKLKEALAKPEVQKNVESMLDKGKPDPRLAGDILLNGMVKYHADICNPERGGYKGGAAEWDRLNDAMSFDIEAACQSASYGGFQLMGFNHAFCGYPTAKAMMLDMARSESKQLLAVVAFIKSQTNLLSALRKADWVAFAKGYNGAAYATNKYDTKLVTATKKWQGILS